MTTLVSVEQARPSLRFSDVPLLVWCLLGVAFLVALDLAANPLRLLETLGDTDDAARLTQVRLLMSGAGWYDTTVARFGGTEPLVSHWSRIVDLPLALMISFFKYFTTTANAETLTRYMWPLIVLFCTLALIARAVEARSDRVGAFTSVLLTVTAFSAIGQFLPGRIDHHNMMILGAVGGILLLAESLSSPRVGWWAGALLALGTAVGYEALSLSVAALAIVNLQPLVTGRGGAGAKHASIAFAATLVVLMLATVGPSQLFVPRCDQVSPNIAVLAAFGAAGSAAAYGPFTSASWQVRLGVLAGTTLVGLAIFAAIEPACLKGPFGQIYPEAISVWLVNVLESQNILWLLRTAPATGFAGLLFVVTGIGASIWLAWRKPTDCSILLLSIHVAALLLACWQIKLLPYSTLLSVVSLSVLPAQLAARTRWSPLVVRVIASMVASQAFMFALVAPAVEAMSLTRKDKLDMLKGVGECLSTKSMTPLASLAPGLAVNDIDLGPYFAALTRLDAVAAPYHRIGKPIVDTDAVLFGPIGESEAIARRLGAVYVAICPGLVIDIVDGVQVSRKGLRHALLNGETPTWLEPVAVPAETPVKVWRIKR